MVSGVQTSIPLARHLADPSRYALNWTGSVCRSLAAVCLAGFEAVVELRNLSWMQLVTACYVRTNND